MSVSICAVIATRNEALHLQRLLAELDRQDIDFALLDHGSEDETDSILARYRHRMVAHQWLAFTGEFSLERQLQWKADVIAGLAHDWVVHHDSDESMRHGDSKSSLRDAIEQAAGEDYTVLDFDEFVFLPRPGSRGSPVDFLERVHGYYFFQPTPNRLNRAWRRDAGLKWNQNGGHQLAGPGFRCSPVRHQLRHYIGVSEEHLQKKYVSRRFSASEVKRGWHSNRVGLTAQHLLIPQCAHWLIPREEDSAPLRTGLPAPSHYWHWPKQAGAR